ncbi:hypothetical protein [Streptomyces flaveus]|uniref:Uncharacterized protein n=1 Tax=Streptomyces flaveus TaxID=66370 RepID=A0A917RC90_9ACTN|nr:hypothetical protein [Streptomyces flaveus]GGL00823.1 hypothetical protein GCM10010094_71880 [Streptomyces flaveus]
MPSYDSSRGRFRLSGKHLAVLGYMTDGEQVATDLMTPQQGLIESGLIDSDGNISILLAPLISALTDPTVTITVESLGEFGRLHHGLVIGDGFAFSHESWPGEEEVEYVQLEPIMLVWALARMVNLQPSDLPQGEINAIDSKMSVLDAGLATLNSSPNFEADSATQKIREELSAQGLLEPELSTLSALLAELRSSWRMIATWQGEDEGRAGLKSRGFAIWDCGPLGYWHRELPAEPILHGQISPESPLRLVRVEAKQVWEMITNVFPGSGEFATP